MTVGDGSGRNQLVAFPDWCAGTPQGYAIRLLVEPKRLSSTEPRTTVAAAR